MSIVVGEALGGYVSDFRQPPVPAGWQGEGVSEDLLVRRAVGCRVRRASAGDRSALEAMFLRCTPSTVYRRFHGQVKAFPASYLAEALSAMPEHYALVACAGGAGSAGPAGERVVALASCRLDPDRDEGEIGILVEDEWQRRGLGSSLLRLLASWADGRGVAVLQAQMLTEQDWLIGLLAPYGHCSSVFRPGVREVRVQRERT